MPNEYHPPSPIYDPTHKEDAIPICDSKEKKMALDTNYYPPNYIPSNDEVSPTLTSDLVPAPEEEEEEEGEDKDSGLQQDKR